MTGYRSAILLALLGSASPALLAQDKLDRELDFVRSLAERMRFIELAKEETERLAKEHRGAADQDRIAQLSVQISYHGAKARSDRSVQRTLYKEAIEKSKELIERSTDDKVLVKARATLADASQEFGNFLIEELELARESDPDRVKELEEESSTVFRAGIDACGKVMENLEPLRKANPEKDIEYGLFWMRKGVLMREQGRAVKADRAVLIERAINELTELVLDFGEETALGLRGLFEIAQCSEVGGDVASAIDVYKSTVGQIAKSLEDADEMGLPGEVQALLFEMMQEVYVRTGEVMARQGDPETAELFVKFRAHMASFGEKGADLFDVVDPKWGHQMLLAEARFDAESGDPARVGKAIAMIQRINDKHPNDFTGIKAKAALRDVLAVQKNLVSGKLLFEIAKGEFQNKNYEASVKGLRRALAAMNREEGQEMALEAWHMLGTAFALTDRYLESLIALTTGLERHGEDQKDRASDVADTLDKASGVLKKQTKSDTGLATLQNAAAQMIAKYSTAGAGKIFYKEANEAFNAKNYALAITKYREVPTDFVFFETAQVRIAKCSVLASDFAGARAALAAYKAFTEANPLRSSDAGKSQVRQVALLEAEFLDAQMSYWEARGNSDLGVAKTPTKYPEAIQKLRAYATNHGKDDPGNVPVAIECLGRLHADLGELDRSEEAYAQLKTAEPLRASRLATEIFVEYQNQVKTLDAELTKTIAGGNETAITAAQKEIDRVRSKLGAIGLDYIANSNKPQIAVLVNTMLAFEALGDWKRVDEIAQKTLADYGADTSEATKRVVDLTVRPMIGEALLRQRKFTQAYPLLIEAEKANPGQWELKRQIARCLGGWFEFNRTTGQPVREPGLNRAEEAYLKYYTEYRPWGLRDEVKEFSLDWYRFHWESYWFAREAAAKDSKYKDIADKFYRKARSTDDFATLRGLGEKGLELARNFQMNRL